MTSVSLYNIQTPQEIRLLHGLVSPRQISCKILLVNFFSPGISFYLCVHVGGNTEKFALYLVNWFQSNLRGQLTISLQIQIIFFLNEFYFFLNPIIFVRTGTTCMSHANGAGSGYVKFVLPISETASQFPFRGNKKNPPPHRPPTTTRTNFLTWQNSNIFYPQINPFQIGQPLPNSNILPNHSIWQGNH